MYNTRNNNSLHLPLVHLTKFSKGPYITGIRVFNHLPQNLKISVHDSRKFKCSLKTFLYQQYFYSTEEYYEHKEELVLSIIIIIYLTAIGLLPGGSGLIHVHIY